MSTEVANPEPINIPGEVGTSTGTASTGTASIQTPSAKYSDSESQTEKKKTKARMLWEKVKQYANDVEADVEVILKTDVADRNAKALFSIGIAIFFTWFIIWAFLSWSRFSSVYASTSAQQRAKAAFLFILTILSVFILIFSASMMAFRKERGIYITLFFISVGLLSLMFALVGSDALTA